MADSIAYLSADLEDSLRGGFVDLADIASLTIVQEALKDVPASEQDFRPSVIRSVCRLLWKNLYISTKENLSTNSIQSLRDVQQTKERIVSFSPDFKKYFQALKRFLFDRYYGAPEVLAQTQKGKDIIQHLFSYYIGHPEELPESKLFQEDRIEKRVCDYIAGMTDDFAEKTWAKIKDK